MAALGRGDQSAAGGAGRARGGLAGRVRSARASAGRTSRSTRPSSRSRGTRPVQLSRRRARADGRRAGRRRGCRWAAVPDGTFGLLVLDAFSSDAVPAHLFVPSRRYRSICESLHAGRPDRVSPVEPVPVAAIPVVRGGRDPGRDGRCPSVGRRDRCRGRRRNICPGMGGAGAPAATAGGARPRPALEPLAARGAGVERRFLEPLVGVRPGRRNPTLSVCRSGLSDADGRAAEDDVDVPADVGVELTAGRRAGSIFFGVPAAGSTS